MLPEENCNLFKEYLSALACRTYQGESAYAEIDKRLQKPPDIDKWVSLIELALSFLDHTLNESKANLISALLETSPGPEKWKTAIQTGDLLEHEAVECRSIEILGEQSKPEAREKRKKWWEDATRMYLERNPHHKIEIGPRGGMYTRTSGGHKRYI
jgi:hypothetical protein